MYIVTTQNELKLDGTQLGTQFPCNYPETNRSLGRLKQTTKGQTSNCDSLLK